MSEIKNILVVHDGENVDSLKQELRTQFPMLENVMSADVEWMQDVVKEVPYVFHLIILTPKIKKEQIKDLPYAIHVIYQYEKT